MQIEGDIWGHDSGLACGGGVIRRGGRTNLDVILGVALCSEECIHSLRDAIESLDEVADPDDGCFLLFVDTRNNRLGSVERLCKLLY